MKVHFFKISFLTLFLASTFETSAVHAQEQQSKWDGYVEFEARKGNHRDIGETEFFIPITQNQDSLLFLDVRGMLDNKSSEEGNLGLGYRTMLNDTIAGQKWIVGGYGFLDIRNTEADNKFYQGTFGLEALSENWDLRTNVYIPETTEKEVSGTADVRGIVSGTQLRITGTDNVKERALPGVDAEIGYKLPVFESNVDALRFYGGGFHFDASGYDNVSGPRGRLELSWNDLPSFGDGSRFTLGAEIQHDDVRDTTAFGIARLRIPFQTFKKPTEGRRPLTALERRMTETIVRDIDIVSGEQDLGAPVNEAATVTINGTAVSNITLIDATDNVPLEVTNAGAGSTVIIDGSQGQVNLAAGIVMQDNQTITGGGIEITGTQSGLSGVIGTRPNIVEAGVAGTTILAANAAADFTLQNFDLTSDVTGNAIQIIGNNVLIQNITSTGGNVGLNPDSSGTGRVENVIVTNTAANGITLGSNTAVIDTRVTNAGAIGISSGFTSGSSINNVLIDGPGTHGISVGFITISISNTTVMNAGTDSFTMGFATISGINNTSVNPGGLSCNTGTVAGSIQVNGVSCP